MKLKKLTKQYRGHKHFKYCDEFTYKDGQKFMERRTWCWEQWGPSAELDLWQGVFDSPSKNPQWCWITDQHRIRIYLATDAEASWYGLKWS
jgi:hypothetical protein